MARSRLPHHAAAASLLLAAASVGAQEPVVDSSTATPSSGQTRLVGTTVQMRLGSAALADFRADVPPVEEGGECQVRPQPRDGVREVTAYYPSRAGARAVVALTVDSTGRLLRYSERRGLVSTPPASDTTAAGREAQFAAAMLATRSTTISLDLVTGLARFSNTGGGAPNVGATARAEEVLALEHAGRPGARAEAVLARCTGMPLRVARLTADSLPRDFVLALLGGSSPATMQLRVAEPASRLPADVLPPEGELVGSVDYPSRSTTAVLVDRPSREVLDSLEARLLAVGWVRPPMPEGVTFEHRGFVATFDGPRQPPGYCSRDAHLTTSTTRWRDGRTLLRVVVADIPGTGWHVCRPPRASSTGRERPFGDSIIPTLQPPAGARVQPTGASGGTNRWEVGAQVESSLSLAELLSHYATELRSAGWEPLDEATGTMMGSRLYQRTHEGVRWTGLLTITERPGATFRTASLRLDGEERR